MNGLINLLPCCEVISMKRKWSQQNLREHVSLIIEFKGKIFLIKDEVDKVVDVSSMPVYIKEDWINYNKILIDDKILIEHIKEYEERVNWQTPSSVPRQFPPDEESLKALDRLKSIKRDLTIRKII